MKVLKLFVKRGDGILKGGGGKKKEMGKGIRFKKLLIHAPQYQRPLIHTFIIILFS
jgi:hypothetical protein